MTAPPLARRIAVNTAAQVAGKLVVVLVGAVSITVSTRYLGAAGYGRLALAFALLQLVGVLADAGLTAVVVRELSRAAGRDRPLLAADTLVGTALALRLGLAALAVAVALAVAFVAYDDQVRLAVAIAAVPFACGVASSALATVAQARLRMERVALADAAGRLASLLALLAVVALDGGFALVVASAAVGAALTLAAVAALVRRHVRLRVSRASADWRRLAVAAAPIGVTLAVTEAYLRADALILSAARPYEEVGHYTLAFRVYELLGLAPAVFVSSVFPLLSRLAGGDPVSTERLLAAATDVLVVYGLPLAVGGALVAGDLARALGGAAFAAAADPLRLLLVAMGAAAVSGLYGHALIAAGRQKPVLKLSVLALAVNLAANAVLVGPFGATGAAAAVLGCEVLLLGGGWWLLRTRAGLRPSSSLLGRTSAATALMACAVWAVRDAGLAVAIPVGAAVYGVALVAVGGVNRRRLEALRP
jgi:O-antigen/teichoic acid export membrane protein